MSKRGGKRTNAGRPPSALRVAVESLRPGETYATRIPAEPYAAKKLSEMVRGCNRKHEGARWSVSTRDGTLWVRRLS